MADITVLGAGSWGTALAALLVWNGHHVTLWSHRREQAEELQRTRRNEKKLPGVTLPEGLSFSGDLPSSVKGRDLLVFAVPSKATRETAEKLRPLIPAGQRIVTVTKGIEDETLLTQVEIISEILPRTTVGILSGPSHAEEVILKKPTLVVAGAKSQVFALFLQNVFMNPDFRVYTSPDVTGIEAGGSLKNVIALAAGMSDGLGFGDNAKAALITRGIREISALAIAMGGREETVMGLTGIGDLIVTCESRHSRNRRAGVYIGQGMGVKEAMDKVSMIVEGVYSAKAAKSLGEKYGITLPIITEVNHVLFDGENVREAVLSLMTRDRKKEDERLHF